MDEDSTRRADPILRERLLQYAIGSLPAHAPAQDIADRAATFEGFICGGTPQPEQRVVSGASTAEAGQYRMIGWAVKELIDGRCVRRRNWAGNGMWLAVVNGGSWALASDVEKKLSAIQGRKNGYQYRGAAFIALCAPDGGLLPWTCSQTDILATDWELAP